MDKPDRYEQTGAKRLPNLAGKEQNGRQGRRCGPWPTMDQLVYSGGDQVGVPLR